MTAEAAYRETSTNTVMNQRSGSIPAKRVLTDSSGFSDGPDDL